MLADRQIGQQLRRRDRQQGASRIAPGRDQAQAQEELELDVVGVCQLGVKGSTSWKKSGKTESRHEDRARQF
jgi:hypothetical protein